MNSFFNLLGTESWKPVLSALLLPPVPLLVLVLVGARLIPARRGLGWLVVLASVALLWLSACTGVSERLARVAAPSTAALGSGRIDELRAAVQSRQPIAIVILGGGLQPYAPEYGAGNLTPESIERLRYGLWLNRQTGAPVAFSGGVGWGRSEANPEAQIAARIAAQEFGRPLRWVEDNSRDTRENAARVMALLKPAGIRHMVLVTHGFHMARSMRAFEQAAAGQVRIEAAPMGLARRVETPVLAWLPSSTGFTGVRNIVHELVGRWAGA